MKVGHFYKNTLIASSLACGHNAECNLWSEAIKKNGTTRPPEIFMLKRISLRDNKASTINRRACQLANT